MSIIANLSGGETTVHPDPTLEVLLIKLDAQLFALRARQIIRLQQFKADQLLPSTNIQLPYLHGLLGWRGTYLPLLDLATLLELTPGSLDDSQQVLVLEQVGQPVGLLVQAAQQIERFNLADLHLLPPLIEQNLLKPAVWALWKRSPTELIPLFDPGALLSQTEWQAVSQLRSSGPIQL